MNRIKQKYCAALIILVLSTTLGFSASEDNKTLKKTISANQNITFIPKKGSLMRKHILDALRNEIAQTQKIQTVFVVSYLKATKDWAWVHVLPQSPDGMNRYEDIFALLHRQNGEWKVAELPCTEIENPQCIDSPDYFIELKKRFPQLPAEILPNP